MKNFVYLLLAFHVSFGLPQAGENANSTDAEVITNPPVDSTEPPASEVGSVNTPSVASTNGGPSSNFISEAQQLFDTAAAALIEQVKSKLPESIEITLRDFVVHVITSATTTTSDSSTLTRKTSKPTITYDTSDNQSDVTINHDQSVETKKPEQLDDSKSEAQLDVEKTDQKTVGKTTVKIENLKPEQLEASKETIPADSGMSELSETDQSKPVKVDDAKTIEKISDNNHRSSRNRKQDKFISRNENAEEPDVRQEASSNAVMVGFNKLAVEEVAFQTSKISPTRVTIRSVIGPINIIFTSNSSQIPVATFSISAPVVFRVGKESYFSTNTVILQGIRAKQLKTKDLTVDDALESQSGTISDDIRRQIISINFDQLWEDALIASLEEENVMSAFIDASNFISKRPRVQ